MRIIHHRFHTRPKLDYFGAVESDHRQQCDQVLLMQHCSSCTMMYHPWQISLPGEYWSLLVPLPTDQHFAQVAQHYVKLCHV